MFETYSFSLRQTRCFRRYSSLYLSQTRWNWAGQARVETLSLQLGPTMCALERLVLFSIARALGGGGAGGDRLAVFRTYWLYLTQTRCEFSETDSTVVFGTDSLPLGQPRCLWDRLAVFGTDSLPLGQTRCLWDRLAGFRTDSLSLGQADWVWYGFDQQGWYGMFVACGIWCLADVSSVSPSSEQTGELWANQCLNSW